MKKVLFYIGWKLQNLGLRFRLLSEAERQKAKGWKYVPSFLQVFREPYAYEVILLAQRFIEPSESYTLVDVGANVGKWSRRFVHHLPGGYAGFEPDARAFKVLRETHAGKTLYNKCVGNVSCKVSFNLNEDTTYSSKYAYDERLEHRVTERETLIEQVRLDDCELGSAPYILKVDVQGAELEVLQGAGKMLARTVMVILEVPLFRQTQGSNSLDDIVVFLKALGFQSCYFCHGGVSFEKNTIPIEHDIIFLNTHLIDPVAKIL
jgi:FkbM family methyltransferase